LELSGEFSWLSVFVPALNGYVYQVSYDTNVVLQKTEDSTTIATFDVPITLNLRHAISIARGRKLSWLEVGVIAFVGGIVFTQYDTSVTPVVMKDLGPQLGEYLATEIMKPVRSQASLHFGFTRGTGDTLSSRTCILQPG